MLTQQQQIFEQIKKARFILITFSKVWSGDGVASALAMYLFLKKLGKEVEVAAEEFDRSKIFSWLPGYAEIKNSLTSLRSFIISLDISQTKVNQIKYRVEDNTLNFIISPADGFFTNEDISSRSSGFKYDLIIALDTPDLESLGKIYDNDTEFFYKTPIINIDHHSSNEEFGQINLIELTAVSTCEILFSLFESYDRTAIDEDVATCLLAGMISKTRSFKTPNVTPGSLSSAAQLISMGARREEIVNRFYRSRDLSVLKLWGKTLANLKGSLENKLIWSTVTLSDSEEGCRQENDLSEVIDELIINIPQAKVIVIVYEKTIVGQQKTETYALIHAMKNIDSLNLVKEYNPIGSKSLASISLEKPLVEAEREIIDLIEKKLNALPL